MVTALLTALVTLTVQTPRSDTADVYATPATRALIERAVARHRAQDTTVADYRAQLHYRLSASVGRWRWGRSPTVGVEEQEALVHWQRPNDLRIDVIGRRVRTRNKDLEFSSVFRRPWFVPRFVGDSVRIFSDDFPATGALHPLAAGAAEWYRYVLTDSLQIASPGTGRLKIYEVQVTPRRAGPALVTGRLWLDGATAEVVRFTFRYVGTALWARPEEQGGDSSATRRLNSFVNRILSIDADLEYGRQDNRHWMPYRQVLSGRVKIPVVSDLVVNFQAVTTFDDYEINTGRPIVFALPLPDSAESDSARAARRQLQRDSLREERRSGAGRDSLRAWDYADRWHGGRFEVHRPSNDSLARYRGWRDSLDFELSAEDQRRIRAAESDLARLVQHLPDELTGARPYAFGYERFGDALRYDRVQGLSLGAGLRVRVPAATFTNLYGTLRYGFSDERVTGRLSVVRDAPGGRLVLSGYRDIASVDPFAGASFANSANALFAGHDNADWYVAQGGSASWQAPLGIGLDLRMGARVERQTSAQQTARSAVNDFLGGTGEFPANPPVDEGTFVGGGIGLTGVGRFRWTLDADVLGRVGGDAGGADGGAGTTGRVYGSIQRGFGTGPGVTLRAKAGVGTSPTLAQSAFRLGGLNTVRGFDYGVRTGQAFWSAQADFSPLRGGGIRPVFFLDAGQAGDVDGLLSSRVLVGGGVGVSLYVSLLRTSLVRFDVSRALAPDGFSRKLRFDLVFQAPR